MTVGERRIVGQLQPGPGRQNYEKAKQAGQKAATVEQNRPNLFTSRIANIAPGEEVTVEVQYQQPVNYRHGEFELRLPTTLTPDTCRVPLFPRLPVHGNPAGHYPQRK